MALILKPPNSSQSIVGKVAELSNIVQSTRPDLIHGQESWLTIDHLCRSLSQSF